MVLAFFMKGDYMGVALFGIAVFIVLTAYSACVVAGKSDDAIKRNWKKEDK